MKSLENSLTWKSSSQGMKNAAQLVDQAVDIAKSIAADRLGSKDPKAIAQIAHSILFMHGEDI